MLQSCASSGFAAQYVGLAMLAQCLMQVLKPEHAKEYNNMSLGEYVKQQGYSQAFICNYLLPMCAAVWSVPNTQVSSHAK